MLREASPKLLLLGTLYLSQGLPYGFFTQALPVMLRERGLSLGLIGATSLLALPWALKFLWAPFIDRVRSTRFGRRRAVILPLQAAAALLVLGLAFVDPDAALVALLVSVLLANLIAATQDIATDALAVETLAPAERGWGNGVQVAGYRVGMILGGGALLLVFDELGWTLSFVLMSATLVAASIPLWRHRERPVATEEIERVGMGALADLVRRPGMGAWLLILVVYKSADALASGMLRPFLVDVGLSLGDVGWLIGVVGFIGGLLGALAGGALVVRVGRSRALIFFGVLQSLAVLSYAVPALGFDSWGVLIAVVGLEHFVTGMATVTLFTMMMDRAEEKTAGTDYTLQASVVVIATGGAAALSGVVAEAIGYTAHFVLSGALSFVGLAFIGLVLLPRAAPPRGVAP
jgi:MFS family permease